ncbi:hypothetical protein CC1G_07809 [Coprinopsis cinerea okayama7|uniref:Uncharacterized protein n=1 Tax=Coprinopsis cinerea (strain Okayama-7 / 130 / ATCC MYA-4618 / FGSC 9003) TaxID=240176 RepID=A8NP49_COPC7|nr:hypothetical protein CC1G_07809 [Coprinopsis cinerea okayama7\|eukprot:XP_001835266.2 hypothetical protein CC1G_07809 [Coprinopsis cinerea okayama7\
MDTLPSELLEFIFEEFTAVFDDDPKTLASCSLVSRAFCVAAQPLLFREVSLETKSKNTQSLVTALKDSPGRLSLHVRKLELRSAPFMPPSDGALLDPAYSGGFCPSNALACVELPNLVQLTVAGPYYCYSTPTRKHWNNFPIVVQTWILDICTRRKSTQLCSLTLENLHDVPPSILQMGPTLKRLTLVHTTFDINKLREPGGSVRDSEPAVASLCQPKYLEFSQARSDILYFDLKIFSKAKSIVFDVFSSNPESYPKTNDVLKASENSIRRIAFMLRRGISSTLSPALCDLGLSRNLTYLNLTAENTSRSCVSKIANTLSTLVPGIPLRGLCLGLFGDCKIGVDRYHGRILFMSVLGDEHADVWKTLDETVSSLARRLSATLSKVHVHFWVNLQLPDGFDKNAPQSQQMWNENRRKIRELYPPFAQLLPETSKLPGFYGDFDVGDDQMEF